MIRSYLYPKVPLKAYLKPYDGQAIRLSVANPTFLPVIIDGIVLRQSDGFLAASTLPDLLIIYPTPLLRNYPDAVDGISSRLKARIRWYGDLFSFVGSPCLELKGKEGYVFHKSVYPLNGFNFSKGMGAKDISALFQNSGLPAEINSYLSLMEPVLVNRYRRKYWCSRDGGYRLTLDHKLWFSGFIKFNNRYLQQTTENTDVIVEIKYDPEADDSFPDISNRFAFRQSRSSKYVSGMEHVYQLGHSR